MNKIGLHFWVWGFAFSSLCLSVAFIAQRGLNK